MNAREHRQKRKQWKENSKVYRNKKAIAHRNLQRILDDTPPLSPISVVQQIREDVAARNRRQMRKRRAILYAKIVTLEKRMKNAVKLSEKYKKRYLRLKTQKTDSEAPATKVNALLKNVMYEPGHGKGAPDGVGGTLKRTADKVVAEGHDIVDLNSLKPILQSRCPSILLFEVTTADISLMDNLIKQSRTIPTFRGTQKIRQFVFFNNTLQCRRLSCIDCEEDCTHYHLGYFQQHQSNRFTKRRNKSPQKSMELDIMNDNHQLSLASCSRIQGHTGLFKENDTIDLENVGSTVGSDSDKIATIGDYVLMKWGTAKYPGEVLSVFEDGLMVRCMKV
ncbi:unnamed protein product [Arctia plantaginis]|uniref:Uncharacterized protein n=1 Tax=Arctia plantaginis TaxID=874455 RepID=A0A8S1ALW3_ARCPL|nr:unnamed protein product [Arctia plantaginis]